MRLALILCVASGDTMVRAHHIQAGWAVVDYSMQVIESVMDRLRATDGAEIETRILNVIRRIIEKGEKERHRGGLFTKRDVNQRLRGSHGVGSDLFMRSWEAMVKSGVIRPYSPTESATQLFYIATDRDDDHATEMIQAQIEAAAGGI